MYSMGLALVVWLGRIDDHLVLRRSLLGHRPSDDRKPSWAWLTMYYDPGRALGIKPWLGPITPMPLVTLTVQLING